MHHPTDKELECTVARMLQVGVSMAALVVFAGGVLLLAHPLTHIVRVAFCLVGFARQRDKLYIGISSIVLVVLIYSLTRGAH
jgi:uncharacterized membrane protein